MGVNLTNRPHQRLGLKMSGAIHLFPPPLPYDADRENFKVYVIVKLKTIQKNCSALFSYSFICLKKILTIRYFNPLKADLNPICHLLALLGAHHILHVSRIRVKLLSTGKSL